MTVAADLDRLQSLGGELHGLAGEAMILPATSGQDAVSTARPGLVKAVDEALDIAHAVVSGVLIPGIRERLSETGDVMINVARQFEASDEQNAEQIAALYTAATGEWAVTDPA